MNQSVVDWTNIFAPSVFGQHDVRYSAVVENVCLLYCLGSCLTKLVHPCSAVRRLVQHNCSTQ